MKTKAIAVGVASLLIALSLVFFAEAGQGRNAVNASITTSGALEDDKKAICVPAELALIGMEQGKQAKTSPGIPSPKPVGMVKDVKVEPGDIVKRGDVLFTVDDTLAKQNLKKAQAQYDTIEATLDSLGGSRSDIASKKGDLNQAEATLKSKRAEAKQTFAVKYAEGQAKVAELKSKLASVAAGLTQARGGLSAVTQAEDAARQALAEAQALPDSDPAKPQKVAQAKGMLEGALQKRTQLTATIEQLSAVKAKLAQGASAATAGLAQGKRQFNQGLAKMDQAQAKIAEGKTKISEGVSKLSRKIELLKRRRDQAEVGVRIANQVLDATSVRASTSGRIIAIRTSEGSVVYPGQTVMSIVRTRALKLTVYVPLDEAATVKNGDSVDVEVDAAPGQVFEGKVIGVGGKATFAPSNMTTDRLELVRVVKVIVEVVNKDGVLKAGMPADVSVH
ncbi:MAG: HlyD family secretion protein [Candidatus Aquicultor sp.]